MATIDKSDKSGTTRAHGHSNGHSNHAAPGVSRSGSRRGLKVASFAVLSRKIEAQFKTNPAAVLAAVGAGSFVLGAVLGSKLGRLALAVAIPHVIQSAFEGTLGQKIGDYARELAGNLARGGEQGDTAN